MNDAVQSRPVDPDQLATRLQGVSNNQDVVSQALSGRSRYNRSPTAEVDWDAEGKRTETIAYNSLVNDGGRPAYPISLLERVSEEPEEYREILRPWQNHPYTSPPEWDGVFLIQSQRWQMFRRWQQDSRVPYDDDMEFAAYVQEQKRQDTEGTEYRPTVSQYLEKLRASFERTQRYYGLDSGDEEFAAYAEEKRQHKFEAGRQWPGMTENEYIQMMRNVFKKKQAKEGIDDGDEGFAVFLEEKKRRDISVGCRWPGMTEDEYLQMLRNEFNREQNHHYWQEFYWLREDHGRGGFSGYVEEAKHRLARHGFTQAFEFDQDLMRQDKLMTWIEYLNYEYSWLDKHTRFLTRLQPKYDEAWQKLVDSGVLQRGETATGFCTMESAIRSQTEEDAAKDAVEHAKTTAVAVLEKAMNDPKSNLTKPVRIRMMKEAKSRLVAAKTSLRAVTRRGDLITEFVEGTSDYRATNERISLQNIRLKWIQEQVPLIEAEVEEAKAAEKSSRARRRTKRKLEDDQDGEGTKERCLKKRRQNHQASSPSENVDSSTQPQPKASKHGQVAEAYNTLSSKRYRRNKRTSKVQRMADEVETISTENATVTHESRRRPGGGKIGLEKSDNPRNKQLRSTTIPPLALTKQLRRSPRFITN